MFLSIVASTNTIKDVPKQKQNLHHAFVIITYRCHYHLFMQIHKIVSFMEFHSWNYWAPWIFMELLMGLHNSLLSSMIMFSLQWRHNGRDGVSNHQPHHCLLNRLYRRRSKKTSNSVSLTFVRGIHRWSVKSPHKGPVTRKMFPLDDVIMFSSLSVLRFTPNKKVGDSGHDFTWLTIILY